MRDSRVLPIALLAVALATPAFAQEEPDNLIPAPNRRSDEGKGPFKTPGDPRRHADRRHRRRAARSGGHRDRGRSHRADPQRRHARPAARSRTASRRKPTSRSTRPASTYCPASWTCTCTRAPSRRTPRPSTPTSSGWRTASPPCAACRCPTTPSRVKEKERSAKNQIVAPRIFNYQRAGTRLGQGRSRTRPKPRANGCAGRRRTASTA